MGTATNCSHWRDYSWKCFWLGCQGSLKVRVGTFVYCNVFWYLVLITRSSKREWRKPRILFRFVDHCHCSALACRSLKTFLSNAITDVYLWNVYCSQIYNLLASWTIFSVLDSRLGPSKNRAENNLKMPNSLLKSVWFFEFLITRFQMTPPLF